MDSVFSDYQDLDRFLSTTPQKWLVTGAAGFIGSHLAQRLLHLNQKVVGLDNFSTGLKSNIDFLRSLPNAEGNFQFIEGDIVDAATCAGTVEGVDYVLHQAAIGSVPRSIEDPIGSHRSNVDGFIQMLKAATDAKVKRFVYASSSAVYGDHPRLPKQESAVGKPLSPYAATKAIDELYADVFERSYDISTVGLRYFNVFGPRQNPAGPYAAVIPLWIDAVVNEKPVYINGDGSYSRDFCFVENVVRANLLAAATPREQREAKVFNIANGDRTTLSELFFAIAETVQALRPDVTVNDPIHRDFRAGDIPHSQADISLAQRDLHYEPHVDVKAGLVETIQFFLQKAK